MKKEIDLNYDLTKILKPYKTGWVAFSPDRKKVVSAGSTLRDAASKAKDKSVVFMKVFPDAFYTPSVS